MKECLELSFPSPVREGTCCPTASWGEQGTFCATQGSPQRWLAACFPPASPLPALCPDVCGKERCWETEGKGKASFLSHSPKQSGVRSRVPFGVPPLWHCAPWAYVAINPLVLPQLFHERVDLDGILGIYSSLWGC